MGGRIVRIQHLLEDHVEPTVTKEDAERAVETIKTFLRANRGPEAWRLLHQWAWELSATASNPNGAKVGE